MNWITSYVRPRINSMLGRRDMPENLWIKCPETGEMVFHSDLKKNLNVIPASGFHMKIAAKDRLAAFFDNGAYTTLENPKAIVDPLKFRDEKKYTDRLRDAKAKTGLDDSIINALGTLDGLPISVMVQEFAFMGFDSLFDERLKPTAAEKWAGYQYVNELGQEEPFPLIPGAEGEKSAGFKASAQDIVDFRKCRTARQWLDIRKMVDPMKASPAVMEHLRLVLISGLTLEGTPDQLQVVREQAAMLLGRCLGAQKGKDVKEELAALVAKSSGKTLKSLWKVALAGAEAQLKPKVPQVV